jgi:hypothetical protein
MTPKFDDFQAVVPCPNGCFVDLQWRPFDVEHVTYFDVYEDHYFLMPQVFPESDYGEHARSHPHASSERQQIGQCQFFGH